MLLLQLMTEPATLRSCCPALTQAVYGSRPCWVEGERSESMVEGVAGTLVSPHRLCSTTFTHLPDTKGPVEFSFIKPQLPCPLENPNIPHPTHVPLSSSPARTLDLALTCDSQGQPGLFRNTCKPWSQMAKTRQRKPFPWPGPPGPTSGGTGA